MKITISACLLDENCNIFSFFGDSTFSVSSDLAGGISMTGASTVISGGAIDISG